MKRIRIELLPALLLSFLALPTLAEALDEQAAALVKSFASQLKPALQEAIKTGGPMHAVSVCAEKAPAISLALSEESGWQVRRVSLKPRNPDAAADVFERRMLENFALRRRAGATSDQLRYSEEVGGQYRYLQAQLTEGICLACHGSEIEPGLRNMIRQHYPGDQAIGFSLGDVRGAISLTRSLATIQSP